MDNSFAMVFGAVSKGLVGAQADQPLGQTLSLWWVVPFVAMLLCIAILPLVAEAWWHHNRNKMLVSSLLGLPVVGFFLLLDHHTVWHTAQEFISFIVLLCSLYVVSGGVLVQTDRRATPLVNTGFLALGAVLASFMGTTGAAMLRASTTTMSIRPAPSWRNGRRK